MASIDKTYVNREELLKAITWAKEIGKITLENGYQFYPIRFIESYNNIDNIPNNKDEFILWNTPQWFDRWLWKNCPLSFVLERLQEQYDQYTLISFWDWHYEKPSQKNGKTKYKFLDEPIKYGYGWKRYAAGKEERKSIYYVTVRYKDEELGYNAQLNEWGDKFGMLPYRNECEFRNKVFSKKAIIRMIDKWNLPSGCIVRIHNLHYYGLDFKILVK